MGAVVKISEVIQSLQSVLEQEGDIPVLIEIVDEAGAPVMVSVGEVSVETRDKHGTSAAFLQ